MRKKEKKTAADRECGEVNWSCGPLTQSSSHKKWVMAQRLFFLNMRGSSTGPSLKRSQEQAIHTIWHAFYFSIGQYDYSANAGFSFASGAFKAPMLQCFSAEQTGLSNWEGVNSAQIQSEES